MAHALTLSASWGPGGFRIGITLANTTPLLQEILDSRNGGDKKEWALDVHVVEAGGDMKEILFALARDQGMKEEIEGIFTRMPGPDHRQWSWLARSRVARLLACLDPKSELAVELQQLFSEVYEWRERAREREVPAPTPA